MDSEQIARIAEEVRAGLPQATDENMAAIIRYVRRAANKAMLRCNRKNIPLEMELVVAEITEAMLRADKAVPVPDDKEVAGISRGDTTINYKAKGAAYEKAEAFLKDYDADLFPFKKMKLPRDVHDE